MLQLMMFLMQHTALSMSILRNFKEKDKSTFHYLEYFLQEMLNGFDSILLFISNGLHTQHTRAYDDQHPILKSAGLT